MFEVRQITILTFKAVEAFGTAILVYYAMARLVVTPCMRGLERAMSRRIGKA